MNHDSLRNVAARAARLACLALAVAALSAPGLRAQPSTSRAAISHEALWTMKRVSAPSVSAAVVSLIVRTTKPNPGLPLELIRPSTSSR